MNCPQNAYEGDMFKDPATERVFYFTGDRWLDITTKSHNNENLWNESLIEPQSGKLSQRD